MQKYISLLDLGWHTLQLPSFLAAYNLSDVGQCVVLHLSGKLEVVGSNPIGIAVFSFFFFPLPGYAILTMSKFHLLAHAYGSLALLCTPNNDRSH